MPSKLINGLKKCNKCKEWKEPEYFDWNNKKKGYLKSWCKSCMKKDKKEWHQRNRDTNNERAKMYLYANWDYFKQKQEEYYKKNKEVIIKKNKEEFREWRKEWAKNNPEKIASYNYKRNNSSLSFDSASKIREEIEIYEEIRESENGNVEVRCANCENWFEPKRKELNNRIKAIYGKLDGESKLYCSQECKDNCPTFHQKIYPKGHKPYLDREAQPELSKMVLERDEYTCIKCQRHQNEIEVHCHHIEGIRWNPVESADIDNCTTLCVDCHREVHQEKGCTYSDMQCLSKSI